MENYLFIHFLSYLPGPLSFYTALENSTIFIQQFFSVSGGGQLPLPLPCGCSCVIHFSTCLSKKQDTLTLWTSDLRKGMGVFCTFKSMLSRNPFLYSKIIQSSTGLNIFTMKTQNTPKQQFSIGFRDSILYFDWTIAQQ